MAIIEASSMHGRHYIESSESSDDETMRDYEMSRWPGSWSDDSDEYAHLKTESSYHV